MRRTSLGTGWLSSSLLLVGAIGLVAGFMAPASADSQPDAEDALRHESAADPAVQGKIVPSSGGGYAFGYAVDIDGDVLAIGAPLAAGKQGKAFILHGFVDSTTFDYIVFSCEHDFMKFPDGDCGRAVASSGDRVAIGMPHFPTASQLDDRGAVRVFEDTGTEWVMWPRIEGSVLGGYFGEGLALDGDNLAIGAPLAGINAASSKVSAYTPEGTAGNGHWELAQSLVPAGAETNLAWHIDIDGKRLALGGTGVAVVYHGAPGSYSNRQHIDLGGNAKIDVALDGDWLVAGNHDEDGGPPGAVHVYEWNGSRYVERQVLTPPDTDHEHFGWSVAIEGDTILVGDPRHRGEAPYAGAVHRYARSGSTWSFVETITARDAAEEDRFGWDLSISEDWIVIGAPWNDNAGGTDAGAVYVLARDTVPPPPPPPPPGGEKCDGLEATIVGTDGDDAINGTPGFDIIAGLGGHDIISGLGGPDLICGGAGNDLILGGSGIDTIYGGGGNDVIEGNGGDDLLYGGPGKDRIFGNGGADIIYGQAGADKLKGGGALDSLYGGGGRDVLIGGPGDDFMWGGKGADIVSYAGARSGIDLDLAIGLASDGRAIDSLISIRDVKGSPHADEIVGSAAGNRLLGAGGDDVIYGKGGNDVLKGGPGKDSAYGGAGADRCVAETETSCER